MFLTETLRRLPKWAVLFAALVLVGLIGLIDHVTRWEWSCFAPYAVPIVLVTWKAERRFGFVFAGLCALAYWAADRASNPYQTDWGFALAVAGWWLYFTILVVAVAALKAERELDQAHIAALEHTGELERQILQTGEQEQQRIGRDLHDSLGPHLAAIRYAASFLANDLRQRAQPEAAQADKIDEMAGGAVAHARDLARGIYPVELEGGVGLAIALQQLAATTSRQTGRPVSFCETGDTQVAASEEGMQLYRIAQEALSNACKHSGARTVTMVLHNSETSRRLVVADDGNGMPAPHGTRVMGLDSMRFRARALGGELHIESKPGEGTIISCEIPHRPLRLAIPPS